MKALIVGRHTPSLGNENIEVVGQENVLFPNDRQGTIEALVRLAQAAKEKGADIVLLQNIPGVVAGALLEMQAKAGGQLPYQFAVIISVPGPRLAGVVREFPLFAGWVARRVAEVVKFVNARAKTEVQGNVLRVEVDPVSDFVFDHIEWLS